MRINISCGAAEVPIEVPEKRTRVLTPHPPEVNTDVIGALRNALANPIGPSLFTLVKGKNAILLVQDQTRSIREKRELAEAIFEELAKEKPKSLHVLIATGTHKSNDPKNKEITDMLGAAAKRHNVSCSFEEHDCEQGKKPEDYSLHVFLGKTPAGTPIYIHKKHMEADVIIGLESMKMHYFAGYSNMLKLLALPGPAGYETVRVNHRLILDPRALACSHPLHYKNKDNPVSNDMYEAYKLVLGHKLIGGKLVRLQTPRPVFILASVSDEKNKTLGVVWSGAGEAEAVTKEALKTIDRYYTFKAKPADILVLGAGPAPYDRHLFYVHNGADTARRGLKKGGKMLIIAECPEGIGPEGEQTRQFIDSAKKPKDSIMQYVRDNFEIGMQKSYKLGELLHEASEVCVYIAPKSKLDEKELAQLHLSSTRDPQKWLDERLKEKLDSEILVITKEATRIALV